jgi:hypothetical protein
MEVMSRMMDRAIEGGFISGFSMGRIDSTSLMVSHMLLADDTLIFCYDFQSDYAFRISLNLI